MRNNNTAVPLFLDYLFAGAGDGSAAFGHVLFRSLCLFGHVM